MSRNIDRLIDILYDIKRKENELNAGLKAWSDEDGDPCEMASCDPSDQYMLGNDIEELWEEFKTELGEI
jgi:hypothetical protein